MIIIVTGTPGTGKTTVAKKIAQAMKYKYLDVNPIAKRICSKYDEKNKCNVVDVEKLNKELISEINKTGDLVIDSHLSHYLPAKYVDLCIVTKTDLKELSKRLKERKYKESKITDNLECEAFDSCFEEAKERGHKIRVIDTTKKVDSEKEVKNLLKEIK